MKVDVNYVKNTKLGFGRSIVKIYYLFVPKHRVCFSEQYNDCSVAFGRLRNSLAKFGLISMKLARGPVDTAPLIPVATVEYTMAAVALQPEKASPSMKNPWPMQPERISNNEIRK